MARSLERVWEEKLRAVKAIEQDYDRWRREQPLVLRDDDRVALRALGQNLPQVWHAVSTTAADRKRTLRFIIREVILDQTKLKGHVWLKILWQTGATSEHTVLRRVHTYNDYADLDLFGSGTLLGSGALGD